MWAKNTYIFVILSKKDFISVHIFFHVKCMKCIVLTKARFIFGVSFKNRSGEPVKIYVLARGGSLTLSLVQNTLYHWHTPLSF